LFNGSIYVCFTFLLFQFLFVYILLNFLKFCFGSIFDEFMLNFHVIYMLNLAFELKEKKNVKLEVGEEKEE